MEEKDIKTVKTTRGELRYYRDWGNYDGGVVMLNALRVKCDTHIAEIRENRTYPLNQSQISRLTEDMMYRYYQNGKVTVWDLYNGATELYKADTMDIPALLPQNRAMVGFLSEQFGI